jgi:hypothetical protein
MCVTNELIGSHLFQCIISIVYLKYYDMWIVARERLGKQARNKYATNNRLDPFLGKARNKRTGVARGVLYVCSHIPIAKQRFGKRIPATA